MRARWLLLVACLSGVGFAGGAAAQETMWDGYASLGAGNAWFSMPSSQHWLAQGRGTAEFSLGGNWGTQLDIVDTYQMVARPTGAAYNALDFADHTFYRSPGQWLFGALAQYRSSTMAYEFGSNTFDQYYLGAEAQAYMGKFSLYGQAAYQNVNYGYESATGWVVRGRARFFVTPEWFIEANALHSVLDAPSLYYSTTENTFGFGTEYHLSGTPLGVFANYSYSTIAFGNSFGNYNVSRVLAGFKWSFGGHSLWDRETGGASLDPFPPSVPPNPPA